MEALNSSCSEAQDDLIWLIYFTKTTVLCRVLRPLSREYLYLRHARGGVVGAGRGRGRGGPWAPTSRYQEQTHCRRKS